MECDRRGQALAVALHADEEVDVAHRLDQDVEGGRLCGGGEDDLLRPLAAVDPADPLPIEEDLGEVADGEGELAPRPGTVFRGTFTLDAPADTFLDLGGYGKGYVWINGHLLGRYWAIGPQQSLYCPAPWLKQGENTIVVLDLLATGEASAAPIPGLASPRYTTPALKPGAPVP